MENSPSGLWRTLGKRVGVTASRVRISYSPPAGFSEQSESPFFMPENGFLSAIPTSLAHMPFCRVMPSNDVGNADIDDTLGDTHDGPNRCVTLSSKGTLACSLIPVQGHVHLTPPASTSSLGNVMLHVYTFLHFFYLFTLVHSFCMLKRVINVGISTFLLTLLHLSLSLEGQVPFKILPSHWDHWDSLLFSSSRKCSGVNVSASAAMVATTEGTIR